MFKEDDPNLNTTESKDIQEQLDNSKMIKYYATVLALDLLSELPKGFRDYERRVKTYLNFNNETQKAILLRMMAVVSQRPMLQDLMSVVKEVDEKEENSSEELAAAEPAASTSSCRGTSNTNRTSRTSSTSSCTRDQQQQHHQHSHQQHGSSRTHQQQCHSSSKALSDSTKEQCHQQYSRCSTK